MRLSELMEGLKNLFYDFKYFFKKFQVKIDLFKFLGD